MGDKINVIRQVNADWLHGELHGRSGNFPVGFVDHVPANLPTEDKQPSDKLGQHLHETPDCIALHTYASQTDGDLNFTEGDHIQLISHEGTEWLKGKIGSQQGIFPRSFVQIVTDITGKSLNVILQFHYLTLFSKLMKFFPLKLGW